MAKITCKAKLIEINSWLLVVLPKEVSTQFSSRGMVMVAGTINDVPFRSPLEPDGYGSHWLKIDKAMHKAIKAGVGEIVVLVVEQTDSWPEPELPADLKKALAHDAKIQALWADITPMARWDWLRWIRATARAETRAHRIEVAFSKLKDGKRRPCCFNRTLCTETAISKNGALLKV